MINGNMFNLFGFDPFDFGKEFNRAIGAIACDTKSGAYRTPNSRVECTEKEDTFYIELPGCKKEDIQVTVADEYTLLVEAKCTVGKKETKFKETLASDKDIDNAKLSYADGLLTITVEPKPKAEPRQKLLQIQ